MQNNIFKMDFLMILSVLAITHTMVLARPADMDLKTKRSVDSSDEVIIFNPEAIKFPTEIRHGFSITINGTIDPKQEKFEVVLSAASNNDEDKNCKVLYNIKNNTLEISPVPPGEDNISQYETYGDWDNSDVHPQFSIKVTAGSVGDNHMFKLSFETNNGGPSSVFNCPIASFDDYESIVLKQGVHSITSLLFEYA